MGFSIKKGLIKMIIPEIKELLPEFDPAIAQFKKDYETKHHLEPGEEITCMLFQDKDEKTFVSFVIMTADNRVRTQLETLSFGEFVMRLIESFKNDDNGSRNNKL